MVAFCNKRSLLAACTLFFGLLLATFMMPFYTRVSSEKLWELSLHLAGVLVVFSLSTLMAKPVLNWIGPKILSLCSLALGAVGCTLIGNPFVPLATTIERFVPINGKFTGYLMVCAAAAFITVSSFEEILDSTKARLMKTKFRLAHHQLFIESAMMIQVIVQTAFVIGPIAGGYLSDLNGPEKACV